MEPKMAGATKQTLRFAENLALPNVQVIVMRANMSCSHCRQRVSNVISKMDGMLDYMVDFKKKEVTVRGIVDTKRRKKQHHHHINKKKFSFSLGLFRLMTCFRAFKFKYEQEIASSHTKHC